MDSRSMSADAPVRSLPGARNNPGDIRERRDCPRERKNADHMDRRFC